VQLVVYNKSPPGRQREDSVPDLGDVKYTRLSKFRHGAGDTTL